MLVEFRDTDLTSMAAKQEVRAALQEARDALVEERRLAEELHAHDDCIRAVLFPNTLGTPMP